MPRPDKIHHYVGRRSKPASPEYIARMWERVNALIQAEKEADRLNLEAAALQAQADLDVADMEDARLTAECARYTL